MNRLQKGLGVLIGIELVAFAILIGARMCAIVPQPPLVAEYTDSITGQELLELPNRYLFDSAEKWRELGASYLAFGFFSKADACFLRAQEHATNPPEVTFLHGFCLERLGEIEQANEVFSQLTDEVDARIAAMSWFHIGRNHLRHERADDALRAFEEAGSDHLPSLFHRAKIMVRSGEAAAAEPLLKRLAEMAPNDLHVWQLRANAAGALGLEDVAAEARDAVERAVMALVLDDTPQSLSAIRQRFGMAREIAFANELQRAGDLRGAAGRLSLLAADDTGWQRRYLALLQDAAELQGRAGNASAARELLQRQLHEYAFPTARCWDLLGNVEFHEQHFDEAWQSWSRSARMLPTSGVHMKLARLAQKRGDASESRRNLALAGQFAGIRFYREGKLEEARRTLREAVAVDSDLPNAWYYLGEAERLLASPLAAKSAFQRSLSLNPVHGRAAFRLTMPEN